MRDIGCGEECVCRDAVVTAYRELTARHCSDRCALLSCARIYRCHHREASDAQARAQVRGWIDSVSALAELPPAPRERTRRYRLAPHASF